MCIFLVTVQSYTSDRHVSMELVSEADRIFVNVDISVLSVHLQILRSICSLEIHK